MTARWQKRVITVAAALVLASGAAVMADTTDAASQPSDPGPSTAPATDFSNLSLEQLLNVQVVTPASLTATDARHEPVDMTKLDSRDIEESGAEDLNHLFEEYVPNAELIDHHTPGLDLGFRGIISDREDKYLYQVNGVTMNNRMLYGASDERDLPIMGDINTVSVITGPASSTYGSGALAGVVDVETYNGLTFQGTDATVRQGMENQYTATELRYGRKLSDDSGLFVYYGFADVQGADAPYYIGKTLPAANGLPANIAGDRYAGPKANLGAAAFNSPWHKAYVSYVSGPWEFWGRYTQDGIDTQPRRDVLTGKIPAGDPLSKWTNGRPQEYQQLTSAARFKKDLSPNWNLQLLESYDLWVVKDQREGVTPTALVRVSDENQLFTQAIATWSPDENESLAFGTEYAHIWYHDPPTSDALDSAPVVTQRNWQTDTISFLAENQWKVNKQWTTFLSGRIDKNTYTGVLFSPRVTAVYAPTATDTFKYLAGISVRRQDDEQIWGQWERARTYARPETLRTMEVDYDRKLSDQWKWSTDAFYEDYNAIGWNPSALQSTTLGRFQIAGGEFALSYTTDATRFTASEGVSTLIHGSVPTGSPPASQGISSAPYGFGNELAAWSPSIAKLTIEQDIGKQWTASGSLVYYSGFPGARDYAKYAATLAKAPSGVPLSDPGNTEPYGPNLYVNAGLEYRASDHWMFRIDGYNLAAIFDQKLSKRNYILRESEFSVQPAAVALSVRYSF